MRKQPKKKHAEALGTGSDTVINAAWLYYHEELNQAEIAKYLHIPRTTVVKLLAEARDSGVVNISMRPDLLSQLSLAQSVRLQFGLTSAYVVPTPKPASLLKLQRALGKATALLLEKMLHPGQTLTTAWGHTIMEVATALSGKRIDGLTLAQASGCLSTGESFNPIRLATILGEKLGAKTYHLPVPALVASVAVKEILLDDPSVRAGLEMARAASAALVGIGRVAYESSIVAAEFFDRTMVDDLKAKGAVGDMVCRSFDVYGRSVISDFEDRLISLTLDDIRKIKPVIAVGGGIVKASAVLGALRTGCIDILITDEQTARKVISLDTAIPLPARGRYRRAVRSAYNQSKIAGAQPAQDS